MSRVFYFDFGVRLFTLVKVVLQLLNHCIENIFSSRQNKISTTCWDSYRQFTNSKQDVNQIIYKKYILYDMINIINKMIKLLLQMVNIRENIFMYLLLWKFTCEFSTLRVFTTIKQLVCNLINNANHTRRRFISLLTNIQTISLQMINIFVTTSKLLKIWFSIWKSICLMFMQFVWITTIKPYKINNILCKTPYLLC